MPKGEKQKEKLLYLMKIMLEKTDEKHGLTRKEIQAELEAYGISSERKSLADDFDVLRNYGIDILKERHGRTFWYRVVSRQFEIAELKLLVDAIQSSKFITEKKSTQLIKKLESLASSYEAKQLQRQVYVSGRIKAINKSIYYNIDEIYSAIEENKKIRFQYFQWNIKKEAEIRKEGQQYEVSPWALLWDNEYYYLLGFDEEENKIKHYRVDKILNSVSIDVPREGREAFEHDIASYTKKLFGMYSGEEQSVKLEFANSLAGVAIDRFGKDIIITSLDEKHFIITVKVAVSEQFFGWIFGLGDGVKILGPEQVLEQMKLEVKKAYERYW